MQILHGAKYLPMQSFVVNKKFVINEKLLIVRAIRQPKLLSVTNNKAVLRPIRRR
jgi:hypothetical protein